MSKTPKNSVAAIFDTSVDYPMVNPAGDVRDAMHSGLNYTRAYAAASIKPDKQYVSVMDFKQKLSLITKYHVPKSFPWHVPDVKTLEPFNIFDQPISNVLLDIFDMIKHINRNEIFYSGIYCLRAFEFKIQPSEEITDKKHYVKHYLDSLFHCLTENETETHYGDRKDFRFCNTSVIDTVLRSLFDLPTEEKAIHILKKVCSSIAIQYSEAERLHYPDTPFLFNNRTLTSEFREACEPLKALATIRKNLLSLPVSLPEVTNAINTQTTPILDEAVERIASITAKMAEDIVLGTYQAPSIKDHFVILCSDNQHPFRIVDLRSGASPSEYDVCSSRHDMDEAAIQEMKRRFRDSARLQRLSEQGRRAKML